MAERFSTPRVLFCPFCGGGTLLLGKDQCLWVCLKCKREFGVATYEAARTLGTLREAEPSVLASEKSDG